MQIQTHIAISNSKEIKRSEASVREILDNYFLILMLKSFKHPNKKKYSNHFKNYNTLLNACSCTLVADKLIFKFNIKKSELFKTKKPQSLKKIFKELREVYKTDTSNLTQIKTINLVTELINNTK